VAAILISERSRRPKEKSGSFVAKILKKVLMIARTEQEKKPKSMVAVIPVKNPGLIEGKSGCFLRQFLTNSSFAAAHTAALQFWSALKHGKSPSALLRQEGGNL
jgi:hypothetical protein